MQEWGKTELHTQIREIEDLKHLNLDKIMTSQTSSMN
jgi:hypothetical protein